MASYYGGATLSREQAAQVAYQAGFRGDALWQMVAIAERESGYNSGAHRTDSARERLSGDRGLWQVNAQAWDDQLKAAGIINQPSDLFNPVTNAKAAFFIFQRQGLAAWGMGSNGWQGGGDPFKGTNQAAARQAVERAAQQGLLGQDWNNSSTQGAAAGASTTGGSGEAGALPKDARLVQTDNGLFALFEVGGGLWIHYEVPQGSTNIAGRSVERISHDAYMRKYGTRNANGTYRGTTNGGDVAELAGIPAGYGTYKNFWNSILDQLIPAGDPRRNDPEILRVALEIAARPDMTPAEIENKLKGTQYYQKRTEGELRWNSLSEAQRQLERTDMQARMAQTWQQFVGRPITGAEMARYLDDVASGKLGFGQWTEQFVKLRASYNPESPWARQLRSEKEEQRARPVDIENTVGQLRQTLDRWGLQWDEKTMTNYGKALVEKRMSDDDLNKIIRDQAKVLYPWKTDENMETIVAAAPWIETYNRVMEKQGSLRTPEIRQALVAAGKEDGDPWSFEQKLKMNPKWVNETKNGQDEMSTAVGQLGELLGMR